MSIGRYETINHLTPLETMLSNNKKLIAVIAAIFPRSDTKKRLEDMMKKQMKLPPSPLKHTSGQSMRVMPMRFYPASPMKPS
jgi:hypothetical protein